VRANAHSKNESPTRLGGSGFRHFQIRIELELDALPKETQIRVRKRKGVAYMQHPSAHIYVNPRKSVVRANRGARFRAAWPAVIKASRAVISVLIDIGRLIDKAAHTMALIWPQPSTA